MYLVNPLIQALKQSGTFTLFCRQNHPFSDGNKRSGAFLFVDFLHRNGRLFDHDGHPVINDTGLAALTLLVAESDPKQKKRLLGLLCICLNISKISNDK